MCGPKYASRQKTTTNAGVDFYITAQAVELQKEKTLRYDELASGRLVGGLNTYAYVGGNPVSFYDPDGLQAFNGQKPPASITGGPWEPRAGARPGSFQGPAQQKGPRAICEYVPDQANGGPKGATSGYWKTQTPGQQGWQRFNLNGNPISPDAAHGGDKPNSPFSPKIPGLPFLICPACILLPLPEPPING